MYLEAQLLRQYRERGKSARDFSQNEGLLLWGYLHRTAGRSLLLPFDPGRGAGWYVAAAYVGKKQLGWDVSVGDVARRPRSPTKGGSLDLMKSAEVGRDFYHMTLGNVSALHQSAHPAALGSGARKRNGTDRNSTLAC